MGTKTDTRRQVDPTTRQRAAGDQLVAERVPRGRAMSPAIWLAPIVFGVIWAVDAYFKWQPAFQQHFLALIRSGASYQASWLHPWYHFWATSLQPHVMLYAHIVAVVETIIAVCLILGFARKLVYVGGALWSFGIWAIPEGFGNMQRVASTDLGPSIAYVAVFVALWALDSCVGPRRYSLDALIKRSLPSWRHVAEVRN